MGTLVTYERWTTVEKPLRMSNSFLPVLFECRSNDLFVEDEKLSE